MNQDKPTWPNPESLGQPSRFPAIFANFQAEEMAANSLYRRVEDNIILDLPDYAGPWDDG